MEVDRKDQGRYGLFKCLKCKRMYWEGLPCYLIDVDYKGKDVLINTLSRPMSNKNHVINKPNYKQPSFN